MCQDIDTGGASPQMIVRAEQTPDTDTVPCNPRPGLNIFMNAAATISTTDHRQLEVAGLAGLVSGGGGGNHEWS